MFVFVCVCSNVIAQVTIDLFFVSFSLQVSALLGRIPSAVGYQPTLATDMGTMQERITTTKKGSITSVQVNRPLSHALIVGIVVALHGCR